MTIGSASALAGRLERTNEVYWVDVRRDVNRVSRREAVGWTLVGVGAAAAITGVLLLLLRGRRANDASAQRRVLHPELGAGTFGLRGAF
ncbi:MAG: hypothetical protein KF901_06875 [Myxococcales bacterium]|nr:hypothetical protein [Myxococcales bacterium]